jgi:hypothetical protein
VTRFVISNRGGTPEPTPNPARLTEGKFGRLLKDGNRQLAGELDQSAAFQRLTERLSSAHRVLGPRRVYLLLAPASLLLLVAIVVLPTIVRRVRSGTATVLVAEDLRSYHAQPVATEAASTEASTPPAQATTLRADGRSASGTKRAAHGPSTGASVGGMSNDVPPSVARAPEPQPPPVQDPGASVGATPEPVTDVSTAPDCLSLARRGQTRDAEACFLKRAEGSGLAAEMALYEVARLRRDVLADAAGALQALAEYRTRFPAGSLRREADMSQLELLVQLGRTDEALKQSDDLLSSSASGERAAELHLLRGHILRQTRSRYAAAAHEYELAESAGARAGDVTYFHALCLEALGRAPEAAALFARYLEQPQLSYAQDARRRLERLKP